ncbi:MULTISPECIES: hypothetical protein [Chryseobacterium]|uniref:Glucan phosphoethanolaminetransferase (Alkaline phosphatase superfamily) n=1 Tax=Chryseobacterium camelliae TaxID=1265445 RepID=A0ABU0TP02_9FLAO|nr:MULTISPECIES: hypothetical protein [Chryseobacterium]MDT3407387.1 glucan phosphoethanolaminetransferase (alkaline phosphatase superfamily) [Pseudacidovorax intermedius]MDQ1098764.1 glucan phosphoethanolaminetransferase (alkaline phosphatase superfamily) [Chryseobacterium camelliae]MDQ1102688.1 glucan phosphoethanolaminetransferase (alkaline phosphatase superfamily) [Chryseobacterium sp. SORGH_AS_1048]MDR6086117.1 glucan phosphoethanolaminetransferase (alkaline phosphatase superfamily) [Chrys
MNDQSFITTGKVVFWLFFILGNISLIGYIISKNDEFAVGGFMLLIFGSIINLVIVAAILVYAWIDVRRRSACMKAVMIILINIPVAILYFFIGISIITL